jgi:hypothetical protein
MKTRRYVSKKKKSVIDLALVILFGLALTGALIISIFERYGEYVFASVIFTALFWSTIEILTPSARHWGHALIRFIPAFIFGVIFGGVLTYYTQFGYYIIEPALSGISLLFFLLQL